MKLSYDRWSVKLKVKDLPYVHLSGTRDTGNGAIKVSEVSAPLTLGSVSSVAPGLEKHLSISYSFLAIRFIDREFHPLDDSKHLNVWMTQGTHWTMITGGRDDGWVTSFLDEKGSGLDFTRTTEYIGRLVRREPCGVREPGSTIEHSKLTIYGDSTVH